MVNNERINRLLSANRGYKVQDKRCYGNYWGSVKFKQKKQNGWKPVCFVRRIVVDQWKLYAKNKNTTKSTQTWLNVWEKWANERKFNPKPEEYEQEDLDKKLQMFYAEVPVRTKEGFFYNFVENIMNKKSYDCSCISWCLVTRDIFEVFKLHWPAARAILRTLKRSLVPYHETN